MNNPNMRWLLIFPFLFFSLSALKASDSLRQAAQQDIARVEHLLREKRRDSVDVYFNHALQAFRELDDLAGWIIAHRKLGKGYRQHLNDYPAAFKALKAGLPEHHWRPVFGKEEGEALTWHLVQIAYSQMTGYGNYREAARYYEKAKQVVREHLEVNFLVAKFIYQELGNIYTRLGEHEAARVLLEEALSVGLEASKYPFAGQIYSDLGLLYIDKGEPAKAIGTAEKGLDLPELDPAARGLLFSTLSKAYYETGNLSEAMNASRAAQAQFEKELSNVNQPSAPIWLSSCLVMQSRIWRSRKEPAKAEQKLDNALAILLDNLHFSGRREVGKLYVQYGALYLDWGKAPKALEAYQQALKSVLPAFRPGQVDELPPAESFYPENTIIEALLGKADTYSRLAGSEDPISNLKKAVACHDLIFSAEQALRASHYYETSKLSLIEYSRRRSEQAIATALQLHEETGDPADLETAFRFAEKSKSILLLEAIGFHKIRDFSRLPDQLLQKEQELKRSIAGLEETLFLEENRQARRAVIDSLEEVILALRSEQGRLLAQVAEESPELYQLRYHFNIPRIEQLKEGLLDGKKVLLEYFVGEKEIIVFRISPEEKMTVSRIPKDFPLEKWVEEFRSSIERFQYEKNTSATELCEVYTRLGRDLFERLVTPLGPLPEELILIPSGVLGYLPFEALLSRDPEEDCRYRNYPYWIREKQISYGYSATFLQELQARAFQKNGALFLGLAPLFDGRGKWSRTDHTVKAVKEIGALFGGTPLIHEEATISRFRELAGHYQVIHLATHAQANAEKGDFSFIVFSDGKDGFDSLFVRSLYNLSLQAELVVLGACETGVGRLHLGEGIISLARGFFYAGARSVVTTLWQVNDRTAREVSVQFYQFLKDGLPRDEALRRAKLRQLETNTVDFQAHPVYWAAMIPMGAMEPMAFPRSNWPYWIGAGALVVFLFLLFSVYKHKASKL